MNRESSRFQLSRNYNAAFTHSIGHGCTAAGESWTPHLTAASGQDHSFHTKERSYSARRRKNDLLSDWDPLANQNGIIV